MDLIILDLPAAAVLGGGGRIAVVFTIGFFYHDVYWDAPQLEYNFKINRDELKNHNSFLYCSILNGSKNLSTRLAI